MLFHLDNQYLMLLANIQYIHCYNYHKFYKEHDTGLSDSISAQPAKASISPNKINTFFIYPPNTI